MTLKEAELKPYSLADDVGGIHPRIQCLLELPTSVVVSTKVRVRVHMHVGVVCPDGRHGLLVERQWSRSARSWTHLLHLSYRTHRHWIPASNQQQQPHCTTNSRYPESAGRWWKKRFFHGKNRTGKNRFLRE